MKEKWHFPLINPVRPFDLEHFLEHVHLEMAEFQEAKTIEEKDKEAVDILHSAETFVRKYFQQNGRSFEQVRDAVVEKNRKRGYYTY